MKKLIAELISAELPELSLEDIEKSIENPPKPELGDFAFPCFRLAKVMHKAPNLIAGELAEKIKSDAIDRIDVAGAYLNFYMNKDFYLKSMIEKISQDNFGASDEGNGRAYSSVRENFVKQ